jgi:uncharacterized BrkB/YihY/UPF0761 family membrane protein
MRGGPEWLGYRQRTELVSFGATFCASNTSPGTAATVALKRCSRASTTKMKRSFIRLNTVSLVFTLGILGFVIVALLTITVVPQLLSFLGLPGIGEIVNIARWPILFVVARLMIAVVYHFGPSRDRSQWRWISPGSLFAALVWIAASLLLSWYTSHFGS